MVDEALNYLEKRQKQDPTLTSEVIVVDGREGQTSKGIISSPGEKILMADADGATKFPDVEKLEKGLSDLQPWPDQKTIACGYQAHLEKESIAQLVLSRAMQLSERICWLPFTSLLHQGLPSSPQSPL
ncbi:dolichyl-phosphate beta-glucosyltransferase-like isoform X1 [Peromyscus maniculatus bairdii]|uniref:dolichyl-phosphate beta-glucosyltransferase-like isoform X1 n=1 Tax=Peromyscus maniculatus bairdii TaxID=230844 RepID=UPI003FD200B0